MGLTLSLRIGGELKVECLIAGTVDAVRAVFHLGTERLGVVRLRDDDSQMPHGEAVGVAVGLVGKLAGRDPSVHKVLELSRQVGAQCFVGGSLEELFEVGLGPLGLNICLLYTSDAADESLPV